MSYIPGSNNGTWGYGMHRALFPKSMGGALGYRGHPLPNAFQHPAAVMDVPYRGHAFGSPADFGDVNQSTVYALTPGGNTTEAGWGFEFGSNASQAMKLKHELGISLKDAWKIVKGETRSPKPYGKRRSRYSFKPCKPGYYRHSGTNRCRKVRSKAKQSKRSSPKPYGKRRSRHSFKPCKPGYYRHSGTNRCRKVKSKAKRSSPKHRRSRKPCKSHQYRSRKTGRCRNLLSGSNVRKIKYRRSNTRKAKKWPTVRIPPPIPPPIPPRPKGYQRNVISRQAPPRSYKRKPCKQGQYRHPRTKRCRNLGLQSRTKMMKGLSHVKQKRHQARAKEAMKLKHERGISLKEAWALV